MKLSIKVIILPLLVVFLSMGFLFNVNFALADDGSLCEVDADVILVLDVSGSMEDGGSLSKCEWSEIKAYGGGSTWYLNTKYGATEEWCSNTRDSFDESAPSFSFSPVTYTPEVLSKIEAAKAAGKSFLDNLKSQDQSGLVSFADTANLEKGLSNDHNATKTAVDAVVTGGSTNIGDAIAFATAEFNGNANPQATKTIILLTDGKANKPNGSGSGEDPADVTYAIEKATEAGNLGYKVFTIGLGDDGDINAVMLQSIADITGANYHHANGGSDLTDIYDTISQEMCQYSSISGCKYKDLDNNGTIDPSDEVLPDFEIVLGGDALSSQLTNQNGCYTFAGLSEGSYTVSESANSSFLPFNKTYPIEDYYDIALAYGENVTDYNFANYFPVCGNNILDSGQGEQCDDGNLEGGDGCSLTCQLEQEEPEPPEPGEIQPGDIVINEIMQNPKVASDATGEWFELYNTTDNPIDLIGCVIRDDGSNSHTITSLMSLVPANGYSVLAKSANLATNGGITPDYVYSSTTLGNVADQIILECNSVEIDRVEYDSSFPLADGASMTLADPLLDNNVGANWCEASSPYGAGDLGTPGVANDSCGITPPVVYYTITSSTGANGSITPSGSVSVSSGADQLFTITPDSGFEIADILVDAVSVGALSSYNFTNVISDHTILANFSETEPQSPPVCQSFTYSEWNACGVNGTQTRTVLSSLPQGCTGGSPVLSQSCTYAPPAGGGGGGGGGGGWQSIYTIITSVGAGGSISPAGSVSTASGNNQTFTITPNSGYQVADVLVDGVSVGAVLSYTFDHVGADHTISASFSTALSIFDEQTGIPLETSVILTWKTNIPATSRIVYGTVSNPAPSVAPNYGYSLLTAENSEKTTYHIVLISGLEPGTTYYWRAISHGSGEVVGTELSFSTEELYTGTGGPTPPQPAETTSGQAGGIGGTGENSGNTLVLATDEQIGGDTSIVLGEEQDQGSQGANESDEFVEKSVNPFLASLRDLIKIDFCSILFILALIIIILLLASLNYKIKLENKAKYWLMHLGLIAVVVIICGLICPDYFVVLAIAASALVVLYTIYYLFLRKKDSQK